MLTRARKRELDRAPRFNAFSEELGDTWAFQYSHDIQTGYRIRLNWHQTIISLFKWHNETVNIWTHIMGACLFCFAFFHIPTSASTADFPSAACEMWHQTSPGLKAIVARSNLTELRDYMSVKLFCMGVGGPLQYTPIDSTAYPKGWQRNSTHCLPSTRSASESFVEMVKQSFAGQSNDLNLYKSYNRSIANLGLIAQDMHAMDDSTLVQILRQSFGNFREAMSSLPASAMGMGGISSWRMMNATGNVDALEHYLREMANYTQLGQFGNMSQIGGQIGEQMDSGMERMTEELQHLSDDLKTYMTLMSDYAQSLEERMQKMIGGLPNMSMANMTENLSHMQEVGRLQNLSLLVEQVVNQLPDIKLPNLPNLSKAFPLANLTRLKLGLDLNLTQLQLQLLPLDITNSINVSMPVPQMDLPEVNMEAASSKLVQMWSQIWHLDAAAGAEANMNITSSAGKQGRSSSSSSSSSSLKKLETWPIGVFLATAVVCMVFSSLFHLLYCRSQAVYLFMVRLDYSGIALLIGGSYFPWLYYNFYCHSSAQKFYLTTVVLLGAATFFISMLEFFSDPKFNFLRMVVFMAFGAFCVVPTMHTLYINSFDIGSTEVQTNVGLTLLLEVGSYFCGAMIFLFRLPERWTKGTTDVLGSSHQIWHVFVVLGAVLHFKMCNEQFYYRQQHMCTSNEL